MEIFLIILWLVNLIYEISCVSCIQRKDYSGRAPLPLGGGAFYVVFSIVTIGLYGIYWCVKAEEHLLKIYEDAGIPAKKTYAWQWYLFGSLIIVGPFIAFSALKSRAEHIPAPRPARDYQKHRENVSAERFGYLFCALLLLGGVLWLVHMCKSPRATTPALIDTVLAKPEDTVQRWWPPHTAEYVLDQMQLLRQKGYVKDYDGDNKVDCCDYSILFASVWLTLYDEHVDFVTNQGGPSGMKHLFIKVNGLYIEPQADPWLDHVDMLAHWGQRYDARYNRISNNRWRPYVHKLTGVTLPLGRK